jgi:hypothetical protein
MAAGASVSPEKREFHEGFFWALTMVAFVLIMKTNVTISFFANAYLSLVPEIRACD